MNFKHTNILAGCCLLFVLSGCKKDDSPDVTLYNETIANGYTYYTGTTGITAAGGNSPHGFMKVKFNNIAQQSLDGSGKLAAGEVFPQGSIIVKEIYTDVNGSLELYAVMKKDASATDAGSGYLWAEYEPDGKVLFSVSRKGDGCISCHSQAPNRDLVRTFDIH